MVSETELISPFQWTTTIVESFVSLIITAYVLGRERYNRQRRRVPFSSRHLSKFSFICIATGPVVSIWNILRYFKGICLITRNTYSVLFMTQCAAMECFQLSRLYYCFSKKQAYSDKGYPKWVFWFMYSWLVLAVTSLVFAIQIMNPTTNCGINSKRRAFVTETVLVSVISPQQYVVLFPVLFLFTIIMDVTTTFLYWNKVRSFRKFRSDKHNVIYQRIQSILQRVLILTFLYQIVGFWIYAVTLIVFQLFAVETVTTFTIVESICMSYSMLLMQDHNTKEYKLFLRFLRRFKLYFCCCCCYGMVIEQHRVIQSEEERNKAGTDTVTLNSSINQEVRLDNNGMEMSVQTTTIIV